MRTRFCSMNRGIGNSNIKFCLSTPIMSIITSSYSGGSKVIPFLSILGSAATFRINNSITDTYASDSSPTCCPDSTCAISIASHTSLCCYSHIAYIDVPT